MQNTSVNKSWKFWKGVILKKDGSVNITQLKKELSDFSHVLEQVPKVYMHITNNLLSKPNYFAEAVISKADECYREATVESVKEFLQDMKKGKEISKRAYDNLMAQVESYF